jgi:hypothetical protein
VFHDDGRSDFHALLTKRGGDQATLVAFERARICACGRWMRGGRGGSALFPNRPAPPSGDPRGGKRIANGP